MKAPVDPWDIMQDFFAHGWPKDKEAIRERLAALRLEDGYPVVGETVDPWPQEPKPGAKRFKMRRFFRFPNGEEFWETVAEDGAVLDRQHKLPAKGNSMFLLLPSPGLRRRAGARPAPDALKLKAVKGWRERRGRQSKEGYCCTIPCTPKTLTKWENEMVARGELPPES